MPKLGRSPDVATGPTPLEIATNALLTALEAGESIHALVDELEDPVSAHAGPHAAALLTAIAFCVRPLETEVAAALEVLRRASD